MAFEIGQRDVWRKLERPVEMGAADEMAQVGPARGVLRIKRQVVDHIALAARNAKQGADDRLHPFADARLGKRHRAVKPVAVADGDRRKAALLGQARNGLGIDRPFEHRIARQHAQRDEGGKGHRANVLCAEGPIKL